MRRYQHIYRERYRLSEAGRSDEENVGFVFLLTKYQGEKLISRLLRCAVMKYFYPTIFFVRTINTKKLTIPEVDKLLDLKKTIATTLNIEARKCW